MEFTALTVESKIGKNPAMNIITIAGISPIQNTRTINGSHATGAIGLII